mgnify:CR=1 FL=1
MKKSLRLGTALGGSEQNFDRELRRSGQRDRRHEDSILHSVEHVHAVADRRELLVVAARADDGHPGLGGGADAGAVLEIVVGPDMDDGVQGADLGVPERRQLAVLFPYRQRFGEALLRAVARPGIVQHPRAQRRRQRLRAEIGRAHV